MIPPSYIEGFLVVRDQVIEPIEVPLLLSEGQLQLVNLIVFLLNGSKLLIQRLLREGKDNNVKMEL